MSIAAFGAPAVPLVNTRTARSSAARSTTGAGSPDMRSSSGRGTGERPLAVDHVLEGGQGGPVEVSDGGLPAGPAMTTPSTAG